MQSLLPWTEKNFVLLFDCFQFICKIAVARLTGTTIDARNILSMQEDKQAAKEGE
jgi:hypothetical protein